MNMSDTNTITEQAEPTSEHTQAEIQRQAEAKRDDIATAKAVGITVYDASTEHEPSLWGISFPDFLEGVDDGMFQTYLTAKNEDEAWSLFWEDEGFPRFTGEGGGDCFIALYQWAGNEFGLVKVQWEKGFPRHIATVGGWSSCVNGIKGPHTALCHAICLAHRAEQMREAR